MKRTGKIIVIYRSVSDPTKKVSIPYKFSGLLSLIRTVMMSFRTRCNEVTIFFDSNPKSHDKQKIAGGDSQTDKS